MERSLEVGRPRGMLGLRELRIGFGVDPVVHRVIGDHISSNCVDGIHTSRGGGEGVKLGDDVDIDWDLKPETEWDRTNRELDNWLLFNQMESLNHSDIP